MYKYRSVHMCFHRKMNVKSEEEMMEVRRGPWTVKEDIALMNYISQHGEGRWDSLAQSAGLQRSGKSCRLRWLNYLRPDIRRGNLSPEEQLLILELHSRWGNQWSKIAQHLPGRTDNEIKNYWRTRVQKHAKQLKCDINSKQFKDTMRHIWMPRLAEKIQAVAPATTTTSTGTSNHIATGTSNATVSSTASTDNTNFINNSSSMCNHFETSNNSVFEPTYTLTPENSSTSITTSSKSLRLSTNLSNSGHNYPTPIITIPEYDDQDYFQTNCDQLGFTESLISPVGYHNQGFSFQAIEQNNQWTNGCEHILSDNLWNAQDIWY